MRFQGLCAKENYSKFPNNRGGSNKWGGVRILFKISV